MDIKKSIYVLACLDQSGHEAIKKVYDQLNSFKIFGNQTKDLPYHITCLYHAKWQEKDNIINQMKKFAVHAKPIDVYLDQIETFHDQVLFYKPNDSTHIINIAMKLNQGISKDFYPHVTLLIDKQETIQWVKDFLLKDFVPIKTSINKLCLYTFEPTKLLFEVNF